MAFNEEKLIILVSQYPEIYDQQNEHYMNSLRKNNIWKEIGEEMGASNIVCKDKWKSLRDSYHRNIKTRKSKSGDGATKNKKWKYELQMEFLLPYLQERTTKDNFENAETITSNENKNDNSLPELMANSPEPVNSPLSSSSASSLMYKRITARKKNQTQPTQQLSVASTLQNYLASRPTPTALESGDPIHSFFKAMADTVKTLPPDLQFKAKKKVYEVVSHLEYENLIRNSTSFMDETETVTRTYPPDDFNKQLVEPTPSISELNKRTSSEANKQLQDSPTPSTSAPKKLFSISHTTSKLQDFQVQPADDLSQETFVSLPNNQSQIVLDNTQNRYIITPDGYLISQDVINEYEEQ